MTERLTYVYTRVSTEEQARGGVSMDDQRERALAYLRSVSLPLGNDHVRLLAESGVSGSIPIDQRPLGGELMRRVREGAVANVVAFKLDRLFRDAGDALRVTQEWDKAGVALHLLDLGGQAVNTKSAMGRFMLTVVAGAAEMERNLIRERTRSALEHKKLMGERLGAPPLGLLTGDSTDPDQMETVRLILKLRRRDPQRWSFREIAARLEAEGRKTKKGGRWAAQTVKRVWDRRAAYQGVL
jgi:DNA invertase Pin-like site-specific DNA recombinase